MRQAKYSAKNGGKDGAKNGGKDGAKNDDNNGAKNDDNNGAKNGVWRLRVEISAFGGCILRVKKKDDKMVIIMVCDAYASKYPPKADASLSAKKRMTLFIF